MIKTAARMILAVAVLLAGAPLTSAFGVKSGSGGIGCRWNLLSSDIATNNVINQTTRAIRYKLAADGVTTTNTAAELDAVRAAFAQWQAVSGTHLKFEDAGLALSPVGLNPSDCTNIIYWEKKSLKVNGGRGYIGGRTGYTVTREDTNTRAILEADIVFNAVEKQWTTDCAAPVAAGRTCVGAVALHEIGHFIGLGHSPLGGATMFFRAAAGDSLQAGLSADDLAGVRSLYPANPSGYGAITGRVLKENRPVFGAAVYAHTVIGCAVAGTVTDPHGDFLLSMLPVGLYQVHAAPLDPPAPNRLCAAADIAPDLGGADTEFLPTIPRSMAVVAGKTNNASLSVVNGTPAFRITNIRVPTSDANVCSWWSLPARLRAGQSNYTIGVASATLPTNHGTLAITGDGLTLGPPTFLTNAYRSGLNFISASISVSSNATPGLRSFIVQHGTNFAYAHGFLEIMPTR